MRLTWLAIHSSYSHSSLALPMVHAAAEGGGVPAEWSRVQATVKDQVPTIVAQVVGQRPDVLTGTAYLFNRQVLLSVVRRVKVLRPDCLVILGGPEFLGDNAAFLESEPAVDVVLRGEGEEALPHWLEHVASPESWTTIPGLCWRDADGRVHDDGRRAVVADLNALPSPTSSRFFDWSRPFVQLETSRGCFGTCSFCTSAVDCRVRTVGLRRIAEDLEQVRDRGVREVRLLDRTFNANSRRAVELLRLFRTRFPDLRFHLEIHPALLNQSVRDELAVAPPGVLHLEVGLQTTSETSLLACRRMAEVEASLEGLRFLCGCPNLEVHVDLLAGLPGIGMDHIVSDLDRLTRMGPQEIQLEILKILPGTPLAAEAGGLGIDYAPDPPYEVLRTPTMSLTDLQEARHVSQLIDSYYNQPDLHAVIRRVCAHDPEFYQTFRRFLVRKGALGMPVALERRFQLLHDYLQGRDASACQELELVWLKAGFSPQHGLCRARLWKGDVPGDAQVVEGALPQQREVRVWHLRQDLADCWVVFDRSSQQRRAAAVCQRMDV